MQYQPAHDAAGGHDPKILADGYVLVHGLPANIHTASIPRVRLKHIPTTVAVS